MTDGLAVGASETLRDYLLFRELAEVYLLLDNVSTAASKALPASPNQPGDDKLFDADRSWIQQICEIGWPPPAGSSEKAKMAAQLLRAKELLNTAAAPATGTSIAFTTAFGGDSAASRWWASDRRPPEPTRRSDAGGKQETGEDTAKRIVENAESTEGWPPTRGDMAAIAYPHLSKKARSQWWGYWLLYIFFGVWLLMTCWFSWDVATGTALLAQVHDVQKQSVAASTANNKAPSRGKSTRGGGVSTVRTFLSPPLPATTDGIAAAPESLPEIAPAPTPLSAQSTPPATERRDPVTNPTMSGPSGTDDELEPSNATYTLASGISAGLRQQLTAKCDVAAERLKDWLMAGNLPRRWASFVTMPSDTIAPDRVHALSAGLQGGQYTVGAQGPSTAMPQTKAAMTARPEATPRNGQVVDLAGALLGVLTGIVLPVFYGVLGASVAVVRDVVSRVREYRLMPRHLMLAWIQLGLGAAIGACIGVFFTSGDDGTTSELLTAPVKLSQAALCFVAGFSAEGMFQSLEGAVRRIFNLDAGVAKPSR